MEIGLPSVEDVTLGLLKWKQESGVETTEANMYQVGYVFLLRFVRIRSDYTNGKPKPKSQRSGMRLVQSMLKCEGIFTLTWRYVFMARLFTLVSDNLESPPSSAVVCNDGSCHAAQF